MNDQLYASILMMPFHPISLWLKALDNETLFSMLLFVFAVSLSLSPINLSYEIEWCRQRNISWEDFWGKPDSSSRYSAISATYIQEKHKCDYRNRFTFSVRSVFLKTQSWSTDKNRLSFFITNNYILT